MGPIGSAFLTFIGYKQTDKPNLYSFMLQVMLYILQSKNLSSQLMFRWGFTKWDRCDYDQMKADGRIIVSIFKDFFSWLQLLIIWQGFMISQLYQMYCMFAEYGKIKSLNGIGNDNFSTNSHPPPPPLENRSPREHEVEVKCLKNLTADNIESLLYFA